MRIELGGGTKPFGNGYANIDTVPTADIVHDLNVRPWPLPDDSVTDVYSSHCLEHLDGYMPTFEELCRVCRMGAKIEIRVPSPGSDLEFVWTHKYCWSPIAARNIDEYFPDEFWHGPKRLRLESISYQPSIMLAEFRAEMPMFANTSDESVMKWFPRTCHECRFFYTVAANL
jgi:SAM-dependent methyltransferase